MTILHVPNSSNISKLKKEINSKNKPIAMLVYMEGCGPCNATRPEWEKIKSDKDILIVDLNKDLLDNELEQFIGTIDGFPTIKIIHPNGHKIDYNGNRTADDFIKWIDLNANIKKKGGKKRKTMKKKRKTIKKYKIIRKKYKF
uniref:Thioredoxin domain-containing protein n=1 Tax=viral metagenome TaxID=1070528 RepID=A0A6C0H6E1_9ZZZZ